MYVVAALLLAVPAPNGDLPDVPPLAAYQDPAPYVPDPTPPEDDPTRDRPRLLTLESGRVLRVRCRLDDDGWVLRRSRAWVPVDGEVTEVRLEEAALAEARALEDAAEGHVGRRAELARWMAEQGLYDEALAQLRVVFADAPDHPAGLRAARTVRLPEEDGSCPDRRTAPDLGERLDALLVTGARADDASREAAVGELERWASFGVDLPALLRAEFSRPQHRRREFAGRALRRLLPGAYREDLARRAILDGWGDVREEAALGLRDARDVAVIGPALRALGSENASVRGNAAESLGIMGYAAAVEPLVSHLARNVAAAAGGGGPSGTRGNLFAGLETAYVMDFDVEIAQGASIADPIVGSVTSGVVFDVRAQAQITKVVELRAVMRSLRQLTGEDIPDDPRRWLDWWDENGADWRAVDRARAFRAKSAGAADDGTPGGASNEGSER